MLQRSGRIASRSPEKQEQPRTQIQGGSPYLGPRSQLAATGFAWQALQCKNATRKRWNVLECARGGHKSGHKLNGGRILESTNCWKQWWAGTGLNRRHQDFQFSTSIDGIARLLS